MSREEIQKLLGGYATDTLSESERRALFEAALDDQDLFDALAKEQALRDVLQDPAARQQLVEALGPAREPFAARAWRWLRQPAALTMAGSMAALLIVAGLVLRQTQIRHAVRPEAIVADSIAPRSAPPPAAEPPPRTARPKQFRPPAAHVPEPSAPEPAPPVLPAQREVAAVNLPAASAASAAPPPLPAALAGRPLADTAEVRRQLQTTQPPVLTFNAQSRAPGSPGLTRAKAALSAAAKLAAGYTLLLKGSDGAYTPVPSGTTFHAGDSVRLQVAPSEAGYIYLFQRDATTGWRLVESQIVDKVQRYMVPSTGGLRSDKPTQVELLLVFSRVEQPAFAGAPTSDVDALASKEQTSFRITLEYR